MKNQLLMYTFIILFTAAGGVYAGPEKEGNSSMSNKKIEKSEQEWKKELTPEQYKVLRQKGTEPAFTGEYWNNHDRGMYVCAACGAELFKSGTKFDSGTGWPSFYEPAKKENIGEDRDSSYGMTRTEVHCSVCGGHLGHLFSDGPKPTGMRYCINSASLKFKKGE